MSVNKFKFGDVVKCVDSSDLLNLTVGKEYIVVGNRSNGLLCLYDNHGDEACYHHHRFELCNVADEQPPKFKEGDMVYLIGFSYFKPCKLTLSDREYSQHLKLKVVTDDGIETFTKNGCYTPDGTEPSIVLATEENRQMLNKLLGVEYEPVKLTGSDLAKKLLKHDPQICYVSNISEEYAVNNKCTDLIVGFYNSSFISKGGTDWKFAVPCDSHGRILEDE